MTERLYYTDATVLAFDASVVAHQGGDSRRVILDRTAFYPTSGGQQHDLGTLNGIAVVDVVDADEGVIHLTAEPVPIGPARGEIDAIRRHDHMQQHTAQHLISALAADRLKWPTTSVHFGAENSSIEFGTATASDAQLMQLESWANAAVNQAHPVVVSFEESASATAKGLRTPTKREGELRIVTIDTLDRSACGGTHVATTAAIGAIRLTGLEKVRGQIRVSFVAGERTLRRMRERDAMLEKLAATLSCAPAELGELLPKRMDELRDVRRRLDTIEQRLGAERLQQLAAEAVPDTTGLRRVVAYGSESVAVLKTMAQTIVAMQQVLFIGACDDPPTLIVASSADSGVDAGPLLKSALSALGGKGGGSARIAQGSVAAGEIARAVEILSQ